MTGSLLHAPMAIVGLNCRLPGAANHREFWQLLVEGRAAIGPLPPDRLDRELYYQPGEPVRGKTYSDLGGIAPPPVRSEFPTAECDPCHAILREVAHGALRDASLDPAQLGGRNIGVYVGHSAGSPLAGDLAFATLAAETFDHLRDVASFAQLGRTEQDDLIAQLTQQVRARRPHRGPGGGPSVEAESAATLMTRTWGLRGPSLAVDAACASSLVALLLGSMALQSGVIEAAIIGGASYNKADSLILFSHARSCSATGTRPFDAEADGLISSEGYVVLVLKTLSRALDDGDRIHAVISGLGLSSDGRGKSLWAPRKEGQFTAVSRAYGPAVPPSSVQYVEAHATSTQLGDATEVAALSEFFQLHLGGRQIPLGSVKSNLGHTLETAGLASLVKVVLSMQAGVVPPTVHLDQPSPAIPWKEIPFFVPLRAQPWPDRPEVPCRRSAVNAFGIGGLNVHCVVDVWGPGSAIHYDLPASGIPNAADGPHASTAHTRVPHSTTGPYSNPAPRRPGPVASRLPPVAIIGRGLVLPGARSVAEFERLLESGETVLAPPPPERWRDEIGINASGRPYTAPTNRGGFIRDYTYDWQRFRIPPKQVARANPLQFMLLDATQQALEESGYDRRAFEKAHAAVVIGCLFGGEFGNQLQIGLRLPEIQRDLRQGLEARGVPPSQIEMILTEYEQLLLDRKPALLDETGSFTSSTLASRIAKTYDLMGGAFALEAGDCSSALALDAAMQLLSTGQCSMVVCGAGQRALDLAAYEALALQGRLAGAGLHGSGYLPGEGAVVLLLKRLADAERDGDRVWGVLRGVGASCDARQLSSAVGEAAQRAQAAAGVPAVRSWSFPLGIDEVDVAERAGLQDAWPTSLAAADRTLLATMGYTQAVHGHVSLLRLMQQSAEAARSTPRPGQPASAESGGGMSPPHSVCEGISFHTLSGLACQVLVDVGLPAASHVVLDAQSPAASAAPSLARSPASMANPNPTTAGAVAPDLASAVHAQPVHSMGAAAAFAAALASTSPRAINAPIPPLRPAGPSAISPPASREILTTHSETTRSHAGQPPFARPNTTTDSAGASAWLTAPTWGDLLDQMRRGLARPELLDQMHEPAAPRPAAGWRLAVVGATAAHVGAALTWLCDQPEPSNGHLSDPARGLFASYFDQTPTRVAVLFCGQGSQYAGMLSPLLAHSPAARACYAELDATLKRAGLPGADPLLAGLSGSLGQDIEATQLAVLVADLCHFSALQELGIQPHCVGGHSYGEFAALTAAGVWDLEQAVRVTRARAAAIRSRAGSGSMVSLEASAEQVELLAARHRCRVHVTHRNAPLQTVVAGERADIERFMQIAQSERIAAIELPVPAPYHSPLMLPAVQPFNDALRHERLRPPIWPLMSSVTNRYTADPDEFRSNLGRQLIHPVGWQFLIERLRDDGYTVLIECGPQQVLTRLHRKILLSDQPAAARPLTLLSTDDPREAPALHWMKLRAQLAVCGVLDGRARGPMAEDAAAPGVPAARTDASARQTQPAEAADTPIEHVDATAARRQNVRASAGRAPGRRVAHDGPEVQSFDATQGRRDRRRESAVHPASPMSPSQQSSRVLAELSAGHGANGSTSPQTGPPSLPAGAPRMAAEETPASPPAGVQQFLVDFVVDQTGYPPDMIDLDWDLEADLGIDSIKRAQLLGELRDLFELRAALPRTLDQLRTLRQIMGLLEGQNATESPPVIPQVELPVSASVATTRAPAAPAHSGHGPAAIASATPAPMAHVAVTAGSVTAPSAGPTSTTAPSSAAQSRIEQFVIDFVVDKTGYPPDLVDLQADLEADLGIDSITKAQLFGEVREQFQMPLVAGQRSALGQFRTLADIVAVVAQLLGEGGPAASPPASSSDTSQQTTAPAPETTAGPARPAAPSPVLAPAAVVNSSAPSAAVPVSTATARATPAPARDALRHEPVASAHETFSDPELAGCYAQGRAAGRHALPRIQAALCLRADQLAYESHADSTAMARNGSGHAGQHIAVPHHHSDALAPRPFGAQASGTLSAVSRLPVADPSRQRAETVGPRTSGIGRPSDQQRAIWAGLADGADVTREALLAYGVALTDGAALPLRDLLLPDSMHQTPNQALPHSAPPELASRAAESAPTQVLETAQRTVGESPSQSTPPTSGTAGTEIARRYVLRMRSAPQRPGCPVEPLFEGACAILGDNAVAQCLKQELESRGVAVSVIAARIPEEAVRQLDAAWDHAPILHLFIVTPRDAEAATGLDWEAFRRRRQAGVMMPFSVCQRWLKRVTDADLLDRVTLVGFGSLGGDFGFSRHVTSAESGAVAGLLKAIMIESWVNGQRMLPAKMLDAPVTATPIELVTAAFRELAVTSYDVEIAWTGSERSVVQAIPAPLPPTSSSVARGGAWVCTGGARGITAYVARELATRFGWDLHLVGTAPAPEVPDGWLTLSAEATRELRLDVMRRAREQGQSPIRAWEAVEKSIEITQTLRDFAARGIKATYHSCDVADREALAVTLDRIRLASGPIVGVLHGAGVGQDARFDRKDPQRVDRCIRAKADGAMALWSLLQHDPLRYFIGFGSISGRFGANGHTDYSLANDMLAKLVDWFRQQRPAVASGLFHWHAWGDVGMATKPETRLALESIGMQFMPAREGLEHLLRELAAGMPESEVLITDDRYHRLFFPSERIEATPTVAEGTSPGAWALLGSGERAERRSSTEAAFSVDLDPQRDPFLIEHRLRDKPLLPVVISMELLAEAAALAHGRPSAFRLRDVVALQKLQFETADATTVRAVATRQPAAAAQAEVTWSCELRGQFQGRQGPIGPERVYARANIEVQPQGLITANRPLPDVPPASWRRVEYAERGAPFYSGPPLRNLRRIAFGQGVAWGRLVAGAAVELAGADRPLRPWLVPASMLDACLYATGLLAWSQVRPGTALPSSFRRVDVFRLPDPGETCLVETRLRHASEQDAEFDFCLWGSNRERILEVEGYKVVWLPS